MKKNNVPVIVVTKDIFGYKLKQRKGINHWDELLIEWISCVKDYCQVMAGQDAPFIYTERSNVGLLAGAAWRCKRIALEEFQYPKHNEIRSGWDGRVDLYIADDQNEDLVEAKMSWLDLYQTDHIVIRINEVLKQAINDSKNTKGVGDLGCLAIAFLAIRIPVAYESQIESKIAAAITELEKTDSHAYAWCFPKEFRREGVNCQQYLPGIIMAIVNPTHLTATQRIAYGCL